MSRPRSAGMTATVRGRAPHGSHSPARPEHYRRLFDASPLPMWVYDVATLRFLEVNRAAVKHYGYTSEQFLGMTIADIRPPEDVPRLLEAVAQPVLDGFDNAGVWRHRKRDGTVIDVEITAHAVEFAGHQAEMVLAHDVTARVTAERMLERSRRLFGMLLQTNQLLVRVNVRDALFDGVCRIAVEQGDFLCAWIGLLDADGQVRAVARAGDDGGYIDALRVTLQAMDGEPANPALQALRTGQYAVDNNFLADPDPDPPQQHAAAQRIRFHAAASFPIACDGRTIGSLNLYAADPGYFGPGEQQTLNNMAADVSFALNALKRAEALEAAARVVEASPVVLFRWSAEDGWPVEFVSSNVARWGFRADELMARRRFDSIIHPTDRDRVADEVRRLSDVGSSELTIVYRIVTPAEEVRWVEENTTVEREPAGAVRVFQGTVSDITERHLARLAQQESEQTLRQILETLHVGVWLTDGNGRIVMSNRAGRKIWSGTGSVEPDRYGEYKACWPSSGKKVEAHEWAATRALRTGESTIDEVLDIECFDGTRKTILNSAVPLRDEDGAVRAVIAVNHDITDRHQAEQRLEAAEAQYRQLFDLNPSPVLAYDVESLRIVAVNETAVRHYGWSREEFLAMTIADLRPPEDVPRLREWLTNRSSSAEAPGLWRHYKRDGTIIDVETVSQPLLFAGRPTRIVAVLDVTARQGAQRHARESARLIEIAGEMASIGGWEVDLQTRLLSASMEVCRIHDVPKGTVMSLQQALDFFVPEVRPRIRSLFTACALEGTPYDEELEIVTAAGRRAWVRTVGRAVRDERGRVVKVEGAYQDITSRRRADETLRKLSLAIEQTSECISITDLNGTIEYVNDAFSRVSGYAREELIGRNPRVLQSGSTPRSTYEVMWTTLVAGRTWTGEFVNRRKDGVPYTEAATISPLRQEDGRITHYIAVKEDVTARRRSDKELERYRERLEELVEQRTAQLEQARRGAEAANEAKTAFLANMSHEIRTPMNGVLGMLEILERSRLTEEQAECVQTARNSSETLLGIIDGILDLSKIEAGHVQINVEPVVLADLAEGLCESLQPLARRGDVDLSVFVDPQLPERMLIDPLRLRQILFNLIGNGIKFSAGQKDRRGRVWLRVTPGEHAAGDRLAIAFTIVDNGIGMSAETMSVLFRPFTQGEASTTRRFGGTGLGLTICKRLSELMAGRIDVESDQHIGSTFTVTLPAQPAPAANPAPERIDLEGVKCVLLESPALDNAGLTAYLEAAHAEVQVAQSASAASDATGRVGTWIVIGQAVPPPPAAATSDLRYVMLTQGRRRRPRVSIPFTVTLDMAGLRRNTLLRAVAIAAGRASPQVHQPEPDEAAPPPPAPTVDEARIRGTLILVAEDDEVSRKVVSRQLHLLGYAAEVATDGVEALRLWQEGGHALLLTDLHMPALDGYGLAAAIRRDEARRNVPRSPILALTANALSGEAQRARAAGMDDCLTKPLRLEQLRDALARWIRHPAQDCTGASAAGASIDVDALRALIGDDDRAVRELLSLFLEDSGPTQQGLCNAVAARDPAAVAALAHRLKGSSRTIGGTGLAEVAVAMEAAAKAGDFGALADQLPQLVSEMQRVQHEIRTHLARRDR